MSDTIANHDPILNVPDAAAYIGMSERFVREALRTGQLRGVRLGRAVRVRVSALEEYLSNAEK